MKKNSQSTDTMELVLEHIHSVAPNAITRLRILCVTKHLHSTEQRLCLRGPCHDACLSSCIINIGFASKG